MIERKKSTLNLAHPVAPPAPPAPVRKAKPARHYYYAPAEVEARLRAAYAATAGQTGCSSYNEFRVAAMLAEAQRLEAAYNDGAPFGAAPERFKPGRPLGG